MTAPQNWMYAVAVRDDPHLRLLCRIRRSRTGDVYFLIPREEFMGNPHASYHRSGTRQVRSYDGKNFVSHLQKPDESFQGTEGLFALAIPPGAVSLHSVLCAPEEFSEIFEISSAQLPTEDHHTLAVDLIQPGYLAIPVLGKEILVQRCFQDASPWILVTLWRGMYF